MTNGSRTADEIERDIRDEREQMTASINNLQQKFSVDAIVNDIGSMFHGQGGDIGRAVSQTVGRNPAAVALVGVGLAWLFLGQTRSNSGGASYDRWDDRDTRGRTAFQPRPRQTGETIRSGNASLRDHDQRWFNATPNPARAQAAALERYSRDQAGENRTGIVERVQDAAHAVGDAVTGAASDASYEAIYLMDRLSQGLDDLSEDARARVIAARRAAHDAQLASAAAMEKGMSSATGFFDGQPLVVGALAVAFGAAVGGLLPHSKLEDDTLGESSDRLFVEAQKVLYAERDKAVAMARTAAADVKEEITSAASDLGNLVPQGKSVGDVIVERASEAADRVINRATGDVEHRSADTTQG
jgi:hypothetical protein